MATDDFFRARLDGMVDMRHPLAVLARRMPWGEIEAALAPAFAHKDRSGRVVQGADLFGPSVAVVGSGVSPAGRPRLPIRLMVALLYLKHAFNESDESVVQRWSENVVWQFFSGMEYYSPKLPCDATQLGRFRKILGEAGVEQLLKTTIETAVAIQAAKKTEFERVIVDTTVQEKAVAHPTDTRLLEVTREKITRLAKRAGISLKMTYEREGKRLPRPRVQVESTMLLMLPTLIERTGLLSFISRHHLEARGGRSMLKEAAIKEATMHRRLVVSRRAKAYLSPAASRVVELFSSAHHEN